MKRVLAVLGAVALLLVVAPSAHAAPGNPVLMVSDSLDHGDNPRPLDGQTLSGAAVIWVDTDGAPVTHVGFTLDGQAGQESTRAPWTYLVLTTAALANGPHTIKAGVHRPNGGLTVLTATFTASNASSAQLMVADSPDRTLNLRPLDGATLIAGQSYYIFVGPTPEGPYGLGAARFSEGAAGTESVPPFDLNKTARDGSAIPATFTAGPRTLITSLGISCRSTGPAECTGPGPIYPRYFVADDFEVVPA